MLRPRQTSSHASKLRKSKTRIDPVGRRPTQWLTGVKCRDTSAAKNVKLPPAWGSYTLSSWGHPSGMQAPCSVIGQYLVKVNLTSCNLRLISVLIYHWNLLCHVPGCASRHLSENKLKTRKTAKLWLKFCGKNVTHILSYVVDIDLHVGRYGWSLWLTWMTHILS